MDITSENIKLFAFSLSGRLKTVRNEFTKHAQTQESWDAIARNKFFKVAIEWFCADFEVTPDVAEKYVFVEGPNKLPQKFRKDEFFGSSMNPDAAIIFNDLAIAIEFDHGTKGSQIKNALSKGSFSVLIKLFTHAIVFFFEDSPKNFEPKEIEKNILKHFEDNLNTRLSIL